MSMLNDWIRCVGVGGAATGAPALVGRARAGRPRPELSPLLGVVLRVGVDDVAYEPMPYDVLRREPAEVDVLDALEDLLDDPQSALHTDREVDLRDVAGDDHLGAEAEPGEEHLHLLGRGVLRLVEHDESIVKRP